MKASYSIHAIFQSLQGEGANTGRPCTFIRFAGCNLACPWCDTHRNEKLRMSVSTIVAEVKKAKRKSVIITGGEPTIQEGIDNLLEALRNEGCWLALETNGVIAPTRPELYDYIAVSPKAEYLNRYMEDRMLRRANEVRIVATTDEIASFCRTMRDRIAAERYYISPLEKHGRIHYRRALTLLDRVNHISSDLMPPWCLSIQMHKVLGIR